jgi:hypothetical protein
MTLDQVAETIGESLIAGLPSLNATTQIALDNETFDESAIPANAPWVRLTVLETAAEQRTLGVVGARWWERHGVAVTQCFSPVGTGMKAAMQLAESVRSLFEGVRQSAQLWFRQCDLHVVGSDGQAWFQVNANALFTYEHKH